MDPGRWQEIERLYHAALARPAGERAAFLAEACADDAALRREVESLLAEAPTSAAGLLASHRFPVAAGMANDTTLGAGAGAAVPLTGRRLGVYQLQERIGAGGMGEVYRARDTRLGREVAIKILPQAFTADSDRLARFEREARVLAALNHPNIATIHGLEESDGIRALVMEMVEGESLARRIARGALALPEALAIARQVAEALDAAHEKGIVHRDLKPANIQRRPDGVIKVLDFGLARVMGGGDGGEANSQSPTVTADRTHEGLVMGTAAYMSPEQARGLPVDKRTDIWAFGCVVYEMLTGRAAFQRDTLADTLSGVLEREPDWDALPSATPATFRRLLQRCLEKDPKRRVRDIADAQVDDLAADSAGRPPTPLSAVRSRRRPMLAWGALLLVLLAVAYFGWQTWRSPAVATPLRAVPLASLPGVTRSPSFSPDGNYVAYSWTGPDGNNPDIYVQQIGAGAPLRLTTNPGNDYSPMWSPDGRWIAFLRAEDDERAPLGRTHELRLVPPLTGPERKLTDIRPRGFLRAVTLAWCPDSSCVVVTDSIGQEKPDALFAVSLDSGEKRQLTHPDDSVFADSDPAISPDGKWLAFRRDVAPFAGQLNLLALRNDLTPAGEPRRLTPVTLYAYNPRWMPDGTEILFSAKAALWRLRISGEGTPERLPFVGEDGVTPILSHPLPDGSVRLAYVRSYADANIWRIDTTSPGAPASSPPVVAISSTRRDAIAHLAPDGRQVTFTSTRSGESEIWRSDASGAGAVQLTSMGTVPGWPRWSPNGQMVAFHSNGVDGNGDIFAVPAEGGKPRMLTSHPATDTFASYSRDGRWIYFTSTRSGRPTIWKIPASGGDAVQVSAGVGLMAIESPDHAYIYYTEALQTNSPATLWRLPAAGGDTVKIAEGVNSTSFDVVDSGIYYFERSAGEMRLQYLDLASRQSTTVARNLGNVDFGLSASPDGRTILFTRIDSSVNELMLVDNFR